MKVLRWDSDRDGELTEGALGERLKRQGYRVNRYRYPPGTFFPPHAHGEDKIDAVVRGRFRISMEGESVVLEAGDAVHVPAGVEHSAEVIGDVTVVSLDAVKVR